MTIKELKRGEYFTKKPIAYPRDSQVWIRGEYDKAEKKYLIYRFDDINTWQYIAGNKEIYNDFIF